MPRLHPITTTANWLKKVHGESPEMRAYLIHELETADQTPSEEEVLRRRCLSGVSAMSPELPPEISDQIRALRVSKKIVNPVVRGMLVEKLRELDSADATFH